MQREKGRVMTTMSQEMVKRTQPHSPIPVSLIFESSGYKKCALFEENMKYINDMAEFWKGTAR